MKRQNLINLLTMLISLISVNAYAHDIEVQNGGKTIYYNFINDNTELEVTYKGIMVYGNYVNEYAGEIVIPETVTYESKTYPVTHIKSQAFKSSSVTSVTIPNSVTYIGAYAFDHCKDLTSVTIPNSVTSIQFGAFSGCSSLTSITIPNNVTEIDDNTFSGCSGLTSITIPNSVTEIGDEAFSDCSSLTSITIPNSVTKINNSAFFGCLGLTSLNVESGNTVYDSRDNCNAIIETNLKKLIFGIKKTVIPNSVTCIGEAAFAGSDITSIEIPSNVTKIEGGAFKNCSNLTSVTIPNSVTEIPSNPFLGCSGLTSLNVESGNAVYDSHDNCNAIINTTNKTLICGIKSTTIHNDVIKIGDRAFDGCSGLTSITIPNSVTEIGLSAFNGCSGLTSIEIPSSVTSIGIQAFLGCSGLTSIIIPSSVTSIGLYAFFNCSNLTSVTVKKETPLTINSSIFSNSANATLYVPVGSKEAYEETAGWMDFSEIQEGYDGSTFTAKTDEGIDMVFTVLDNTKKTCQVGYLDGSPDKIAVDKDAVNGPVTIPETVEGYTVVEIGKYAFYYVNEMSSVTIPNTVTSIEEFAFSCCYGLTSFELPASITTIGRYTFSGCVMLSSITIPNSVTSIGEFAFKGCLNLTSVTVEAETPLTITEGVFTNISEDATLYVPAGSMEDYQKAVEWKDFSAIVEAASEYTDEQGVVYSLNADGKSYSVSGHTNACTGEITFLSTVNGFSVTSIAANAFAKYSGITSITIPQSVTSIDIQAFENCANLTSITIQNGLTSIASSAFRVNFALTSIEFPNSVTSIGTYAFQHCSGLTSVTIPNSLTSLGDYAFEDCPLTSVTVRTETPLAISANVFPNRTNATLYVPKGKKSAYQAADYWGEFKEIIEEGAPSIDGTIINAKTDEGIDMVFTVLNEAAKTCQVGYYYSDVTEGEPAVDNDNIEGSLTIPETANGYTVVKIGKYALKNLNRMRSVTIPNTVTSIEEYAFENCNELTSLEIPASVTSIGAYAFYGLTSATSIKVAAGNPRYDSRDNCNAIIETATDKLLFGCTVTTIPTSVSKIGEASFGDMNVYNLSIPSSVTEIDDYAFSGYELILQVDRTDPLVINENAFINLGNSTLRVPAGSKAAYEDATGWCQFSTIFEGEEGSTFKAETKEGVNMVFTILDDTEKTCQVGYWDGSWDKPAVDRETVSGSVTIPETVNGYTVVKIGKSSFSSVSGMTSVTIPNTVTSIDDDAFISCSELTSLELSANVTTIGSGAFFGLSGATSILVAEKNAIYDSRDNSNAIIETATDKLLFGCKNTAIPATVTEIGRSAFSRMFNCTILIPSTINKINDFAFEGSNVTIQVERTEPLEIHENAINLRNSTLYVPAGSKAAYEEATGWKNFDTIMEGDEGSTFTAQTTEDIEMTFTVLDEDAKTCQVGYLDGSPEKTAVDKDAVDGSVTIPETAKGYRVVKIGRFSFDVIRKMTSVTIPNTVTVIDDYAFNRCSGLTSLDLPASVTSIGAYSFYELSNATSIKVAAGNPNYDSRDNCNAIIESATNKLLFGCNATTIPTSVERIGEGAFANLYEVNLSIPSSVIEIEDYAFNGEELTFQVDRTTPLKIGAEVFAGVNMNNSTLRVPAGSKPAYAEATGWNYFSTILEGDEGYFTATVDGIDMVFTVLNESAKTCQVGYIDGSESKTAVDRNAVNGAVTIPETANEYTVVKIGKNAFNSVSGMTSVIIPNTVTTIEEYAFAECHGLTSVELPASVTSIGAYAFYGLSGVSSIEVAAGNPRYDSRDNCNAIIETSTNKLLFGCPETTIPTSVSKIGEASLGNIIYISSMPSSVTEIDDNAFRNSSLILQVDRTDPLDISDEAFAGINQSILRVPAGSKAAYAEATGWSKFNDKSVKNQIFEGNEGNTFTDKTKEGWDMLFTILDDTKKTCIVGNELSVNWGDNSIDRNVVEGPVTIPETAKGYTVVKIGTCAFEECNKVTSISIPNTVAFIDHDAFNDCRGLTSLEIPASVISIESEAFFGLTGLTSMKVSEGNTIFDSRDNCNAIIETATNKLLFGCQNTVIPATVTEIGTHAFTEMSNYTIFIPSTITQIDAFAFYGNNSTIQVESTTPPNADWAFFSLQNSTLKVPAGSKAAYQAAAGWNSFSKIIEMDAPSVRTINVETAGTLSSKIFDEEKFKITDLTITGQLNGIDLCFIREMAGSDYNGVPTDGMLQSLDLSGATIVAGGAYLELADQCIYLDKEKTNPLYGFIAGTYSSVANTFGENLFAGCQQLKSIKTPTSLIEIGNKVFAGSGLTSIDLNSGLTTLDPYAFWYSKLSSITIPKTVIHIGDKNSVDNPFAYINELTSITLEAGNTRYEMTADGKLLIDTQRKAVVTALGNAAIPEGITWIGQNAFCNRPELVNYTIPNWVTEIGGNSFSQCVNLESVVISNQMTTIANSAFTDCPNLTSVTIPSSVTNIKFNAFGNTGLTEITIPSSVTSIDEEAFAHNQNLETVISYITDPFDINDDVFAKGWNLSTTTYPQTLYVPKGTKTLYEAKTGWNKIANIVEMGSTPTPTTERLYSSDISAYKGTQVVLPIILENEQTIAGFQFDMQLPSGFSVVKNGNDYLASLTNRANGLSVSASELGSGVYRFVVVSSDGNNVTGTKGEVMNITLSIPSDATIGENTITLKEMLLTAKVNGENISVEVEDATSKITVLDFTLGDVNNDDHINVTDVVCVVDHILGRTPSNFVMPAADINGNNEVNVADVMGLVDIILKAEGKAATRGLADENVEEIDGLELMSDNGLLSLHVKDARNYVASQMEVKLGEGQTLEGITLNDNFKQTHQMVFARSGSDSYTVLIFSMSNEGYPAGDDELLKLNVSGGAGEIVVKKAMMVTREQEQKRMAAVKSYQAATGSELKDIYSLDGRLVKSQAKDTNGLTKGVYIIDGKKVVVK